MPKTAKGWCAAGVLAVALTACGGNGDGEASPSAVPTAASTPAPALTASPKTPAADPSPTASPSATPSPSPSSTAPATPQSAEKTYKMNKNYDIVPIDKSANSAKVVLLTFDDGPKDEKTLKPILDTLDKHHAKAIFFVNGYRVKAHPELLKEIDRRGQTIGNHSYEHILLGKENAESIKAQIGKVQDIVEATVGKRPVFFRPPNASANDDVHKIAADNGLLFMTWSNGSLDWTMSGTKIKDKTKAIIDNVTDQLHAGSNILMHELSWTADALDQLLTTLEGKGYAFVDPAAIDTGF
ncbi:Peptidoglycan/xylan/chitin deacetylase, PgdA/CDA1 family [Cohnella sp. OV330]|uniref:polysaccharide deacetylase family protein n=1 Tax=Cohnella sp. OV330 TaxID=1855288 RepID=UPI0008DFEC45|nr:polysaccharide deacetylase family protein [Cohnella sp. OV330]SFB18765.1 Peptidoglycan/xylan/chitin deacetylase, PgdA/CDA1 family [Cohnella sp. OV330]